MTGTKMEAGNLPISTRDETEIGRTYDLWVPPSAEWSTLQALREEFQLRKILPEMATELVRSALGAVEKGASYVLNCKDNEREYNSSQVRIFYELACLPALHCTDMEHARNLEFPRIEAVTLETLSKLQRVGSSEEVKEILNLYNGLRDHLSQQDSEGATDFAKLSGPSL